MPDPLGDLAYTWPFYLSALLGYLLGSVPFGLILARLAGAGDIRQIGSGSIGATNVLRTGRKGLALATVLLDGGKGLAAVLLAGRYGPDMAVLAGGGAILGHCFPLWLRFRGGKGVATAAGILLAADLSLGLAAGAVWLLVALASRYSSLAALVAALAAPGLAWWLVDQQHAEFAAFLALVVIIRHHANIRRLWRGEESRIRLKPGAAGPAGEGR